MIDLPQPVLDYLENEDVATAVNALLAPKHAIPTGLAWEEVPTYFRAVGAAQQVKVEYVLAIERFWHAVWDDAVQMLQPASIDQQREWDALTSFDEGWDDESLDRCFRLSEDRWLYTSAGFDRDNAYLLAFIDEMKPKALAAQLEKFDLNSSGDWARLLVGKVTEAGTLAKLQDGARRVVAVAEAITATA